MACGLAGHRVDILAKLLTELELDGAVLEVCEKKVSVQSVLWRLRIILSSD